MRSAITRDQYDAVLLDLDGVITDTANMHAACWKQMFDEYLQKRAAERGEPFRPFELRHGLPALCGWKAPLRRRARLSSPSRGIQLPEGSPDDPAGRTVGGFLNRKNDLVNTVIEEVGVEPWRRKCRASSISSAIRGSKSPSSPQVRTASRLKGRKVGCLLRRARRRQHDLARNTWPEARLDMFLTVAQRSG